MNDQAQPELTVLQSAELTERTPFCPEDRLIAEYFDGVLPEGERDAVERHIADCRFCLARVGMLHRLELDSSATRLPEDVLAAVRTLRNEPRVRRSRVMPSLAAVAVIVMALGAIYQLFPLSQIARDVLPRMHVDEPSTSVRETRTIDPGANGPRFLSPREGVTVSVGNSPFTWTPVPNSLYYKIRIVSDAGDLLWQKRVDGTEWRLPGGLNLSPGAEYFVRVDAYLTDAKTLQSDYLLFRLGERG
jgi:hypothetical protein